MNSFICGDVLPSWIVNSFPVIKFLFLILIALSAIALIVVVMMQESDETGTNAITGIKDSYFNQNKGMNREGRLKKLTIILSIVIAVSVVIFFTLTAIYPNSLWS